MATVKIAFRVVTANFLGLLLFLSSAASADNFQPDDDCSEPYMPYEFASEFERDQFLSEVEDYKQCIAEFVDEQNDAITRHKAAAEESIEKWNSFARSLN